MVMENYIVFSPWAYLMINHVLSLGAACMFAGLVYFTVTAKQISPKYRIVNWLGAVVMVSAALQLLNQYITFRTTFHAINGVADTKVFAAVGDSMFSNGYRYVNWSIDVPVLLVQLVVVFGLIGRAFWSPVVQFTTAGLLMIYTGYIGQYFEADLAAGRPGSVAGAVAADPGILVGGATFGNVGPTWPFWFWFVVSCVFYAWILLLVVKVGLSNENLSRLPENARPWMRAVVYTLIGSWMLYLVGYLMPAFSVSEESAVIRQSAYTIADVVSKVIYGVMIGYVAQLRSRGEGYMEPDSRFDDARDAGRLAHDTNGVPVTPATATYQTPAV